MPSLTIWSLRHRRRVIGLWLLLLFAGVALAAGLPGRIVPGGETADSSQSNVVAQDLAGSRVPTLFAVVRTTKAAALPAATAAVTAAIEGQAGVTGVTGPVASGRGTSAPDSAAPTSSPPVRGQAAGGAGAPTALLQIATAGGVDGSIKVAHALDAAGNRLGPPGSTVLAGGFGAYRDQLTVLSQSDLARAERVGLPILFVVLLLTFGSLAAAALPMVIGLSALVIGLGVVGAVSFWLPMSDFVTNASSMIGIALGVDYTMFLLQRFREVSAEESSPRAAIRRTMRTTGRAVAWSGVTVMLAESTLFLVHSRSIRSAALGMVVVTASALVAALTIVPVSFELFGPRLLRSPLRLSSVAHRRRVANASGSGWGRWAAYVTRRAPLMLAGGLALLAVLAIPSAHLPHSVNISAASTLPASSSTRQAYAAVETTYGPDAESPVVVVVQAPTGSRNVGGASTAAHAAGSVPSAAGAATLARTVAADGDVLSTSVAPLTAGRSAVVITTRTGPYSSATRNLVQSLRSGTLHHQLSGIAYLTGGETAMSVDATSAMFGGLAKVAVALALVIGAMLLLVFRTWWLPLKAVLLVAISLAASLGGLLAMTGSSLGSALIGAPGAEALHPIVPVTIVAIVVALSTDYEVMLITRMAETWRRQRDNQAAIVDGMAHTGGVITSAAAVMIAVFVGFAVAELQPLKQLGVGLALAVFIDATVVRGVLVPAAMALMGRWNWPPLRRRPAAVAGSGLHFGSPVRSLPS